MSHYEHSILCLQFLAIRSYRCAFEHICHWAGAFTVVDDLSLGLVGLTVCAERFFSDYGMETMEGATLLRIFSEA